MHGRAEATDAAFNSGPSPCLSFPTRKMRGLDPRWPLRPLTAMKSLPGTTRGAFRQGGLEGVVSRRVGARPQRRHGGGNEGKRHTDYLRVALRRDAGCRDRGTRELANPLRSGTKGERARWRDPRRRRKLPLVPWRQRACAPDPLPVSPGRQGRDKRLLLPPGNNTCAQTQLTLKGDPRASSLRIGGK